MLNPRTPKSQCFSARVGKSDVSGLIFSSIGANALQVTLTLNFGGEGVVPDRRGLNISSIYGSIPISIPNSFATVYDSITGWSPVDHKSQLVL